MIRKCTTFVSLALLTSSAQLAAQGVVESHHYFFEAGGTNVDTGPRHTDGIYGAFTLYGQEVSHGLRPHTQAAYLEEATSITLIYGDLIGKYPYFGKKDGETEALEIQYTSSDHWFLVAHTTN